MEGEKLEIVLEELLEEHKMLTSAVQELKQQLWQLQEKAADFDKKLEGIKLVAPAVDTGPVQALVVASLTRIQRLIAEQPKTVVHERRLLLFPEHQARDYYRVIFRLILWLTVVCSVAFLYALGKQALENAKEVKLRELEARHYQRAWELLYQQQTKQGKKKMETIWQKSGLTGP